MHVNTHAGDAIESGSAALPPETDHQFGVDLPLPAAVGPEHAVAHRGWREARNRVLTTVLSGPGLVLVLGPPGTGKTLLLQDLARELRACGMDVLLSTRGDLGIADGEIDEGESDGGDIAQHRVVLIDEADRLSAESLERLGHFGRCAFVLAGVVGPREDYELAAAEGTAVVRLGPLARDEVRAFVTARLAQAGLRPDLLTEEAIECLATHAGGLPRLLNMLTSSALFLARIAQASRVDAVHVLEAAALREGQPDLGTQPPAEPSDDPPHSEALPIRASTVAATGRPLRAPAITLTGAHPPRNKRHRRPSRMTLAGLFAVTGLATACAWFLIGPGQRTHRPAPRPEAAFVPASPTPPPVSTARPEVAPPPMGNTPPPTPPAASGVAASGPNQHTESLAGREETSGPESGVPAQPAAVISPPTRPSDTSLGSGLAGARPAPRHHSDHPRPSRARPHPESSASRGGTSRAWRARPGGTSATERRLAAGSFHRPTSASIRRTPRAKLCRRLHHRPGWNPDVPGQSVTDTPWTGLARGATSRLRTPTSPASLFQSCAGRFVRPVGCRGSPRGGSRPARRIRASRRPTSTSAA